MRRFIFPTVLSALVAFLISGCAGTDGSTPAATSLPGFPAQPSSTTTTPSSKSKAAPQYERLLITADDLSDEQDTFHQQSVQSQPDGQPGASAFFVNDKDDRAISTVVLIYPDAATAAATLKQAEATLPSLVAGGTPQPIAVGNGGVVVKGAKPEEDKSVTLMFFTVDRALVRLEFQSAIGDVTTDPFVTNVGKMQAIALRTGLATQP
ncbi:MULTISPECIES: hypothetical protein [Mycobacteriaceae]|uniref:Lipoprotein LpqN n=1 Tax=Mycolicibacterium fluoranthenivorans TaxID=258505 RepID=A0A1G4VKI8_9MYCO|nr:MULTISPECIES: hypothetical protein [Mycobacteriaceae]MCV7254032.1 hypothetical protein [Mycobacterium hackensackense]SCX07385.1 hypothetical protein SAMN02799620_01017 [Mycolicibacterium fluoranthenivorans]